MQHYVNRAQRGLLRRAVVCAAVAAIVLTSSHAPRLAAQEKPAPADDEEIEYVPRTNPPPARRVGAGTRNPNATPLKVVALAPLKTLGYTTRPRPTIYFSFSRATAKPIEIAVNDRSKPENPIGELELPKGHAAGLLKIDLAQVKDADGKTIQLEPERRYEVVLLPSENGAGAANDGAAFTIERLPAGAVNGDPPEPPAAAAAWYAKRGVWFDCIDALNRAIELQAGDGKLLESRRKMVEGEGLVQGADGSISEKPSTGK